MKSFKTKTRSLSIWESEKQQCSSVYWTYSFQEVRMIIITIRMTIPIAILIMPMVIRMVIMKRMMILIIMLRMIII